MTETIPRVSIGIPVYNGENYLRAALDCLLAQTFQDFEVIISDNASTDGTEEICREYEAQDARIRYCRQSHNRGVAWNYNEAFRLARGEYFKWLAHDDLCDPTFLARSVEILDTDPGVGTCYSKVSLIDGSGDRIGLVDSANTARGLNLASDKPHRRFGDVLFHCVCAAEMYGLMRCDLLRSSGLFRPYCLAEKVLIAELAILGKIYEIPEELLSWRQHAEQYTQVESYVERAATTNPSISRWFAWPYRSQSTMGYLAVILRTRLGFVETLRCLTVFLRYAFQISKWRRVIREAFTGKMPWSLPLDNDSARTSSEQTPTTCSKAQVKTAP